MNLSEHPNLQHLQRNLAKAVGLFAAFVYASAWGQTEPGDFKGAALLNPVDVPPVGTFWLMKGPTGEILPPLPSAPADLFWVPVYSLGSGHFLLDDRNVDYAALQEQRSLDAALTELEAQYGMTNPPSPPGGGGGDEEGGGIGASPEFLLGRGLSLLPPVPGIGSLSLAMTNVDVGWQTNSYDLFCTTNLAPLPAPQLCLTNWAWLGRSEPGQTIFWLEGALLSECWFRLGTLQDSDHDGLSDAYEQFVSHTLASEFQVVSSDGFGTPDAWYLRYGIDPRINQIATEDPNLNGLNHRQEYLWGGAPDEQANWGIWISQPVKGGQVP